MDSNVCSCNFGFAFNDPNFSDRILSIEVIPDLIQTQHYCTAYLAANNRKRSRDGSVIQQKNGDGTSMHHEEPTVYSSIQDVGDSVASGNKNKDGDVLIQELSSGDGATIAARSHDFSTVLWVKNIHINSAVLAVKSPFFHKLFSNGVIESEQRVATLRIHASEEAALMKLLNFMYINTLSTATYSSLVDILMVADKYEVSSCIGYCSHQLSKFPMTCDFALSYLNLPYSVLHVDALKRLTGSVKQFIAVQFRDITKFENQVLNFPLAGIEAILSSEDIQVPSEDVLYDLVLKWCELHYPQMEKRREVLEKHLRHHIRFPYMTSLKLREVAAGTNFSPEVASEIVLEALFFQTGTRYRQCQLPSGQQVAGETTVNTDLQFVERAYILRPVKAITVEVPLRHEHCVVYLDLEIEECMQMFFDGKICSQAFQLKEQSLFLSAYCNMNKKNEFKCFGLFLETQEKGSATLDIDCEFAAWTHYKASYTTEFFKRSTVGRGRPVGCRNMFKRKWEEFISNDSYFRDKVLHLRVTIAVDIEDKSV